MESLKDKSESTELFKSKRTEYAVEIRKKKNDELINIKRFKCMSTKQDQKSLEEIGFVSSKLLAEQFLTFLAAKDIEATKRSTQAIRISLCVNSADSAQFAIDYLESGVVKYLIVFLEKTYEPLPDLQADAAWALCNIIVVSKDFVPYMVKNGIVDNVIAALEFAKDKFLENCLWIIANLAGESLELRDVFLQTDIVPKVTRMLCKDCHEKDKIKTGVWLLSNLARGKPYPPFEKFSGCLGILAQLLHAADEKIVQSVLWCFCHISEEGDKVRASAIAGVGILPKVMKLLTTTKNENIAILAFRLCGNVAMGGDAEKIETMLDHGLIKVLSENLDSRKKDRRKEICWFICNIAAEKALLDALFQSDLLTKAFDIMQNDAPAIREEATYIFDNILNNCTSIQMEALIKKGLLEIVVKNLEFNNPAGLLKISLKVLRKILEKGNPTQDVNRPQFNPYTNRIFEIKANTILEELQQYPDDEIFEKVGKIFDDFFTFDVIKE